MIPLIITHSVHDIDVTVVFNRKKLDAEWVFVNPPGPSDLRATEWVSETHSNMVQTMQLGVEEWVSETHLVLSVIE